MSVACSQICNGFKLLLIIIAALFLCNGKSQKMSTFYVKPSPEYICTYHRCNTLSWYIKHGNIFQEAHGNITVIFLPGIHYVSESIESTGVRELFLNGDASSNSYIWCSTQAYFKFMDIETLGINNLTISNCGGFNRASPRVQQFTLLVIFAEDILTLFITNSHFSANNYTSTISANRVNEVVIYNCTFDMNDALYSNGGAISVFETSKFELMACNFTNNHRGAVFVAESHEIILSNCRFVNNTAICESEDCNYGGAISIRGLIEEAYLTTVILNGSNLFENNIALRSGGGLYVQQVILNISGETIFRNNVAHHSGGGLAVREGISMTISNTSFVSNEGNKLGGAVSISHVIFITLTDCTFVQNRVKSLGFPILASGGGAIAIIGLTRPVNTTKIVMKGYLRFKQNHAEGMGGALFVQSAMLDLVASSCIFEGNSAIARGGAVSIQAAKAAKFWRCTLLVNKCWADGGAISLFAVQRITFFDTDFVNNYAGRDAGALRIHSSGIAQTKVMFERHAIFYGNKASGNGGGLYVSHLVLEFRANVVFESNSATYFGGGIVTYNATVSFLGDLLMQHNQGNKSGGGIFSNVSTLYFKGNETEFIYDVSGLHGGGLFGFNSTCYFIGETVAFRDNKAFRSGGGISVYGINLIMNVREICFINNTAQSGGCLQAGQGLGSLWSNQVQIRGRESLMINNNGASYTGGAFHFHHAQVLLEGEIIGLDNHAREHGGWLYTFECTVTISGNIQLEGNSGKAGGALRCEKSTFVLRADQLVVFNGNLATQVGGAISLDLSNLHLFSNSVFHSNSATEGGAIHIDGNSQIHLYNDTVAIFNYNRAQTGGAMFVNDYVNVKTCYVETRCFFESNTFLYEIDRQNSRTQLFFDNNFATNGPDLFGGLLDRCKIHGVLTIDREYTGRYVWFLISNTTQFHVSSFPVRMCFCIENTHNCTYRLPALSRVRGELISISAVVVDQSENPLASTIIRAQFPQASKGELGDREHIQMLSAKCSQLTYHVRSSNDQERLVIYSDDGPCRDLGISNLTLVVQFLPCPLGFELSQQNTTCICHSPLQQYTNTCDIDTRTIQRKSNFWFNYENVSLSIHPHCPFDYCKQGDKAIQVRITDSSEQCAHNRQGTLCGACKYNLSSSFGSSRCLPCKSVRVVWLTLLFAVAGILLIVFLLVFRLTVAVGTINGLVFYANIFAVNKAILFPSTKHSPLLIFIAWLNFDVGIETCYYNGMDTYARTWLQFVFPFYVWTLVGLIIVVSHYSTYAARLFGSNPVSVLATLFLLSYTKLLQTIIIVFSFTYIEYPETGENKAVWLYDANINYLKGKHIVLFVFTSFFLIAFFLPYTFLLLFGQCLRKLPKKKGLSWTRGVVFTSVMDAYHAPYKIKYRYWTGLMLLVRCVMFLIFSFNVLGDPSINLLVINTVLILVIVPMTYLKVYSSKALTFLELSFMINLVILAGITHQVQRSQDNNSIVGKISVIIVLVTFVGILLYHCFIQVKDTTIWRKIQQRRRKLVSERELNVLDSTECVLQPKNVPTSTIVERPLLESLLDEEDKKSMILANK